MRSLRHLVENVILKGLRAERPVKRSGQWIKGKIRAWTEAENRGSRAETNPEIFESLTQ